MPPTKSAAMQSIKPAAAPTTTLLSDPPAIPLGDMTVIGEVPPKLMKACAVIARDLHPTLEAMPRMTPGISKRSCVLCSLVVRDFLQRIGIEAFVAPVVAVLRATEGGKELHSAGIGVPGEVARPRNWNGHLVVIAPRENVLIDTTLYQINRPAWEQLPGMIATQITLYGQGRIWGLDPLSSLFWSDNDAKYEFMLVWLANPTNNAWRNGPDARKDRRRPAVAKLAHTFGPWRDK